jgi:hypothetical protein
MKQKKSAVLACLRAMGLLAAVWLISPRILHAQAAPGPMSRPPAQQQPPPEQAPSRPKVEAPEPTEQQPARQTISGAWKLNSDESDDARMKIVRAQRDTPNRGNGPYGGNGPWGGSPTGGYPPRSNGPWGGGGPYGGNRGGGLCDDNDVNLQRMQEFIYPAKSITLSMKEPAIILTDDRSRRLVFYTDGRKLAKSNSDDNREIAAHWEGRRLVSQERSPDGGGLRRSFDLSQDGRQLYQTVDLDQTRSRAEVVIRYVYDIGKP